MIILPKSRLRVISVCAGNPTGTTKRIKKNCIGCKKLYTSTKTSGSRKSRKYCSFDCFVIYRDEFDSLKENENYLNNKDNNRIVIMKNLHRLV